MRSFSVAVWALLTFALACGGGATPAGTAAGGPDPEAVRGAAPSAPSPAGFRTFSDCGSLRVECAVDDGGNCGLLGSDGAWRYAPTPQFYKCDDAGDDIVRVLTEHPNQDAIYIDAATGARLAARTFAGQSRLFVEHRAWTQDIATSQWDEYTQKRWMGFVLLDPKGRIVKDFGTGLFATEDFAEGLALACATSPDPDDTDENGILEQCGLKGYVDLDGNWAISPQFQEGWPFKDGHAKVLGVDDRHFIIDKTGTEVSP